MERQRLGAVVIYIHCDRTQLPRVRTGGKAVQLFPKARYLLSAAPDEICSETVDSNRLDSTSNAIILERVLYSVLII